MTNLIETAKTTTQQALRLLRGAAGGLASALVGGYQPGEAHLAGPAATACLRASTLDQDLDALLHEIQRRRGRA